MRLLQVLAKLRRAVYGLWMHLSNGGKTAVQSGKIRF